MYRYFLALRYLWSRPISWVSMVGIWLSVTALIATIGIMSGFLRETRSMIRGTTADLIITPLARHGFGRDAQPPPTMAAVRSAIEGEPGAVATSPRLLRPALVTVEGVDQELVLGDRRFGERNFVQVIGLDPALDAVATDFGHYVAHGDVGGARPDDPARPFALDRSYKPLSRRNQDLPVALVGWKLYDFFRLRKGAVLHLTTLPEKGRGADIRPLSAAFVVGGAIRTGHEPTDVASVYIELEAARAFSQASSDVSEICVKAEAGFDLDKLKARLEQKLDAKGVEATVETWMDRHSAFLGAVENERVILGVLLFFFVLVACFNVFATLTIMVSEKVKDIGVLNSMGADASGIAGIFVRCALIMTVSAATVGCASGVLVGLNINRVDHLIEKLTGERIFKANIYQFDSIPVQIEPWFVVLVFVATVVFAFLVALLPALRAARMDPVQALRYE